MLSSGHNSDERGQSVGSDSVPGREEALIRLLVDDAPNVRNAVRAELAKGDERTFSALEAASIHGEPQLRARARQLLGELSREQGYRQLNALFRRPQFDLEEGLAAIDRLLGHSPEHIAPALEAFAARVRAHLRERSNTADAAEALRVVLGENGGFLGPTDDYHHVDHVSLRRTLAARRGLPLTLCALYAAVARRAGFEAGLLPFPGHVLLGLGTKRDFVVVDPFVGGESVSMNACHLRLAALGAPPSPRWLLPAPDRDMVVRQVRNLSAAMERHGRRRDTQRLRRILDAAVR